MFKQLKKKLKINKNIIITKYLYINLNCSQLLTLNIILGHNAVNLKKHFAKYYFFIYNNNIFFNFFWIFSKLKKILLFTLNLCIKKHLIFLFSGNNVLKIKNKKIKNKKLILYYHKYWIKGLISNYVRIFLKSKRAKKFRLNYQFPSFFFVINKNENEIPIIISEVQRMQIPTSLIIDSNVPKIKIDNLLYFIPGNDNSISLFISYYKMVLKIIIYSKYLIKNKLMQFLYY